MVSGQMVDATLDWTRESDEGVKDALGEATFGYIMTMQRFGPTDHPVKTEYSAPPSANFSRDQFKEALSTQVKERMFSQGYQKFSGKDGKQFVNLQLDPLEIPNQEMCSLSYSVVSVTTKDGKNIKGEAKPKPGQTPGALRSVFQGHPDRIQIPVTGEFKPEDLDKATMEFKLKAPKAVKATVFKATDPVTFRDAGGQKIRLLSIQGGKARFRSRVSRGIKAYGFDAQGRCLASGGWSTGGRTKSFIFKGELAEVWLFPNSEQVEHVATIEFDLKDGKSENLDMKPTANVRERYADKSYNEPDTYEPLDTTRLNDLKVEWSTRNRGSLVMEIPNGGARPKVAYFPRWFKKDSAIMLKGNDNWTARRFMWMAQGREGINNATAVIGVANFSILDGAEELSLNQMTRKMPPGVFTLKFDAYNAAGKKLMTNLFGVQSNAATRSKLSWGQIEKVRVVIATNEIKKTIPFEIVKEGTDKDAYEAFKKRSAEELLLEKELHTVGQAIRNFRKPPLDNFAGLFFNIDGQGMQHKGVSEEQAKACQAGAKRYGYEAAPYKGYFISMFYKQVQGGKETPVQTFKIVIKWEGGEQEIQALKYASLLVHPTDAKSATYVIDNWGNVYKKYLPGAKPNAKPDIWKDGWLQIKKSN
jgi:hypothetical protein